MSGIFHVFGDIHEFPTGTELFPQEALLRYMYLLEEGLIALTWSEKDGHEYYVRLRRSKALIGLTSVILSEPLPGAKTLTRCKVRSAAARDVLSAIDRDPEFARELLVVLASESHHETPALSVLAGLQARKRLEQLLWEISADAADARSGAVKHQLPIKHIDLARSIGVTQQHLEVLLREVQAAGRLSRNKNLFTFTDRDRLWHNTKPEKYQAQFRR